MELTVSYTYSDGLQLRGMSLDGIRELVGPAGWRHSSILDGWYVPRSRTKPLDETLMADTVSTLTAAGYEVTVEVDRSDGPVSSIREVVEARKDRAATRAVRYQLDPPRLQPEVPVDVWGLLRPPPARSMEAKLRSFAAHASRS